MTFPPIPSFEGLHPIVVHFPIVLIIFAPIFLLFGLLFKKHLRSCILIAGISLSCGALGAFIAVETGEATAEFVERTEQIEALIDSHAEVAEQTFYTFVTLSVIFWILYFGANSLVAKISPTVWFSGLGVYSIVYIFGLFLLIQTAHQGGLLVHQHGVHAPMAETNLSNVSKEDD